MFATIRFYGKYNVFLEYNTLLVDYTGYYKGKISISQKISYIFVKSLEVIS